MNLRFWLKTATSFVLRSGRTTLILGAMICVAVASLIFITAIATGVNDCMVRNSTGLYTGQIIGSNISGKIPLTRLKIDGVRAVLQRYVMPASVSGSPGIQLHGIGVSRGTSPYQISLVALDPVKERAVSFLHKKIVEGEFLSASGENIILSRELASLYNVGVGDSLELSVGAQVAQPFVIKGLFDTGIASLDQQSIFCNIQGLSVLPQQYQAAIFLKRGQGEGLVKKALIRQGFEPSTLATWQEAMPDLIQLIELNQVSMALLIVLVLVVVAFGTASGFTIFIISRLREYGIMKSMGVTGGETAVLIFSQVILLNVLAGLAGIVAGIMATLIAVHYGIDLTAFTSHNRYFVVSGVIYPRLTTFALTTPPLLGIFFCLAGALWPVMTVVKKNPVSILRSI